MRRLIKNAFFGLIFGLCFVFGLGWCNFTSANLKAAEGEIQECEHVEEIMEEVAPTCTETGLTMGVKCSLCGEILQTQEVVEALGHNYGEWAIVKEATELENGLREKTCSVCEDKVEEEIVFGVVDEPTEEPTEDNILKDFDFEKISNYIVAFVVSLLGSGSFWAIFKAILNKWTNKQTEKLQLKLTELEQKNLIATEQKNLIINQFTELTEKFNILSNQFKELMATNSDLNKYIMEKINIDEEKKQRINQLLGELLPKEENEENAS